MQSFDECRIFQYSGGEWAWPGNRHDIPTMAMLSGEIPRGCGIYRKDRLVGMVTLYL